METFELILDTKTQAIVLPGLFAIEKVDFKKYSTFSPTFDILPNISYNPSEHFKTGTFGQDLFKLGNSETLEKKISFYVEDSYNNISYPYNYAFIGLKNFVNDEESKLNIIEQMKDNDLISNTTWFIQKENLY